MVLDSNNGILFNRQLLVDGYPFVPVIEDTNYDGFVTTTFDVGLTASETDHEVNLSNYGTIKRIIMIAKSGTPYFKLDNTEERVPIASLAMLSHQPTKLELDNDHTTGAGLVEVIIIGKTS